MNDEQRTLVADWEGAVQRRQWAHERAATRAGRRRLAFGLATIALAVAAGLLPLAAGPEAGARVLAALAGVFAAVLAAVLTFRDEAEHALRQREAAARCAALHRKLALLQAFPPPQEAELAARLDELRRRWDALARESPALPAPPAPR
ncbi:hypothetical protein EV699_10496 [Plasticicumulans lactativorans]|uniref:SMODS and SLOG-associating 2TM effector domain-containing protein n=1 Tax=Plasticicumulans lactativorans TaxID=1133106 RepID=A0A4R2L5N3_9GAMM|nr:SLATT domain-containing protein [Plasticicumulans lactativorans]TCO82704.1 hypothetical protein EV699_10496 [Plasticicumulans lactativorans]